MPQSVTAHNVHAPQARRGTGILAAAAAIIVSLLLAFVLSHSPFAAEEPAAAPAAPLPASVSPGTGVPDATAVFVGKDVPIEEPAPTF